MTVFIVVQTSEDFKFISIESMWSKVGDARIACAFHANNSQVPISRYTITEREVDNYQGLNERHALHN
jgi:hypothetical protein